MVDAMRPEDDVVAARGVVDVENVLPRDKLLRRTTWLK
jgi:hypothetical protein